MHGAVLKPLLAEALRRCERQTLLDVARREGLMISPLKGYDDVFADPQAASNESFQTVSTFDDEEVVLTRLPYRFLDDDPVDPYRPAPRLGAHPRGPVRVGFLRPGSRPLRRRRCRRSRLTQLF